ncbi:MAG: putative molybdenum carrier protein [Alphaproteobacteria bacterium]
MKIVAGGQTGVDRAALDAAIRLGLLYGGWVPKGGWAEDLPDPPGLLAIYPRLREAISREPAERTRLNVRDSDATLILTAGSGLGASPGTMLTEQTAAALGRPLLMVPVDRSDAVVLIKRWLDGLDRIAVPNIAGPRESEAPGIYALGRRVIESVLAERQCTVAATAPAAP